MRIKNSALAVFFSLIHNTALAATVSDVYRDADSAGSGTIIFWVVVFAGGWILSKLFKSGDSTSWGAFIIILFAAGLLIYGAGSILLEVGSKSPLLAILLIAFYAYMIKK